MAVALWLALSESPETERMMEAINFFVWTPECVAQKLSCYPGLTTLINDWLLQFFKNPSVGFAVEAGLLAVMTGLAALLPSAWGRRSWVPASLVPAMGISWLALHRPSVMIQAIFFFAALDVIGVVRRKCRLWITALAITVAWLLSVWTLAFPIAALMFVMMSILLLLDRKLYGSKRMVWLCISLPIVWIALTVVFVRISSLTLGFIPPQERWWYVAGCVGSELILLLWLAIPVAAMWIPQKGKALWHIALAIVASAVAGIILYCHIVNDEQSRQSEEVYHLSALAERAEWQTLLSEINSKGPIDNNLYLQFALLAEACLGTMPDNLFLYPINSPETFCPRLHATPVNCDFCRIFYRDLAFVDEAFHQAFQYGMLVSRSSGYCAKSLRHMAEYTVQLGDKALAEKYIYLLERTSNNGELAQQLRTRLAESEMKADSIPLRADNFVKAYAFTSEMAHLLDYDRSNRMVLDYLLCGLLLTKQLELFKTVLNDFTYLYKDTPLPRAYAEAAAMIRYLQSEALSPELNYAPDYDLQFRQFTKLRDANQDDSAFRGTFWYYFVNAQIPPAQSWIDQSQSS